MDTSFLTIYRYDWSSTIWGVLIYNQIEFISSLKDISSHKDVLEKPHLSNLENL